jgi:hypothetical protein
MLGRKERVEDLCAGKNDKIMNHLQKQIYSTPTLFVSLLLCIAAHWLLEPFVEWLDINSIGVYIYMAASGVIISFLLLPRIRLVFYLDGIREGSIPSKRPSPLQTMVFFTLLASMVMLPFAAVNWMNKIGRTVHIYDIGQLRAMPAARYIALSPEIMAQLRPKPAQPVNYTNGRGTYRYAYYNVLVPSDSALNFVWLPGIYYSQDTFSNKMEQNWRDTLSTVLRASGTQFFRNIGVDANKNKYYNKSLELPNRQPVFFEKIAGSTEQENIRGITYLALLLVGSLLFYGILTWALPLNSAYAEQLLQNKVPWWNPLMDRKVVPFKKSNE